MSRTTDRKNDLALLFTILVWGFNIPVIKATLAAMHPHAMNVFRLSVSTLVLGILHVARQRHLGASFFAPLRTHGWQIISLGLIGYLGYQYCFIVGVNNTTAGSAALIMASSPLWTAVFGHFFRFDVLRRPAWIGLLITLAGAAVIVGGSARTINFGDATFFGNMLMLVGAVFWGAYTAFSKPLSRQVTPLAITFLGLLFALPFLYALGLPYMGTIQWRQIDGWVWAAILFSGGLSTGIAIVLWNQAVKHVGPAITAVSGNLVPVVALFSGMWLLDEIITPAQLAGGALILGGLFVMRRTRQATAPGV